MDRKTSIEKHYDSLMVEKDFDEQVEKDWFIAEPLFAYVRNPTNVTRGRDCGCLTMIRMYPYKVAHNSDPDMDLTHLIRSDERIPKCAEDITKENLYVFKLWQLALVDYWQDGDLESLKNRVGL